MILPQLYVYRFFRTGSLTSIVLTLLLFDTLIAGSQSGNNTPLRIIAFGAHPDDSELKASGVAAMWAARGHKVKFVAMTNGDIGHFKEAGGPLAIRRLAEVQQCARILGIETEVMDIHDGELEPSLENRKKVARLIREWQADIVLFHRPYDYHPDHRYVGELVQDAAVVVMAPFYVPDTPPTKRNPVFLYYSDAFLKPYPFEPTIVVGIDNVAQKKWDCVSAMPSQFGDEHSWQASTISTTPKEADKRPSYLLDLFKQRNADVANKYRSRLIELYGDARGTKIRYAEAFELCQYGRQPSLQELKQLFPTSE